MLKKLPTVAVLATLSVHSAMAAPGNRGCYLYEDEYYRGEELAMWGNSNNIANLKDQYFGDKASSARVIGNCRLMIYEHDCYRGNAVLVTIPIERLRTINGGFNDKASSAKCTCS